MEKASMAVAVITNRNEIRALPLRSSWSKWGQGLSACGRHWEAYSEAGPGGREKYLK